MNRDALYEVNFVGWSDTEYATRAVVEDALAQRLGSTSTRADNWHMNIHGTSGQLGL